MMQSLGRLIARTKPSFADMVRLQEGAKGVGVFCTRQVAAGDAILVLEPEDLARVSASAAVGSADAVLRRDLEGAFGARAAEIALFATSIGEERARGREDSWLDDVEVNHWLLLDPRALALLGASPLRAQLEQRAAFYRRVHERLPVPLDRFLRGVAVILSRGLSGEFPLCVPPVLDLLNHAMEHNCEHVPEQNRVVLRAARDLEQGEELTINYGAHKDRYTFIKQYSFYEAAAPHRVPFGEITLANDGAADGALDVLLGKGGQPVEAPVRARALAAVVSRVDEALRGAEDFDEDRALAGLGDSCAVPDWWAHVARAVRAADARVLQQARRRCIRALEEM